MSANEVASFLIQRCGTILSFECYMFGSTLRGVGSDIDLLIVGTRSENLQKLKKELAAAGTELPLDILYMDPSEEKETCFVENEGCIGLWELSQS